MGEKVKIPLGNDIQVIEGDLSLVTNLAICDLDTRALVESGFKIGGGLNRLSSKIVIVVIIHRHGGPYDETVGAGGGQLLVARCAGKEDLLEKMARMFEYSANCRTMRLRFDPAVELIGEGGTSVAFRQPLPEHQNGILIKAMDFAGAAARQNPPVRAGAVVTGNFKIPFADAELNQAWVLSIEAVSVGSSGNRACQQDFHVWLLFKVGLNDIAILRDHDQDGLCRKFLEQGLEDTGTGRGFR